MAPHLSGMHGCVPVGSRAMLLKLLLKGDQHRLEPTTCQDLHRLRYAVPCSASFYEDGVAIPQPRLRKDFHPGRSIVAGHQAAVKRLQLSAACLTPQTPQDQAT
jgi:hypothetical protein